MPDRPTHTPDDETQTVLRQKVSRPTTSGATFELCVVTGPDVGVRVRIEPSSPARVLVGKSRSCDLQLSDREVSRRHLALEVVGARLRVTDLGSTNGTVVQGLGIAEAFLQGGETVTLGTTTLAVRREPQSAQVALTMAAGFGRTLGASEAMRRLYPLCEKLAAADVPVVIEGETGTGKEVLAESLHEQGPRAKGPFIVFDCTAVPAGLVESALFGHERGAFTGAVSQHKGVFEQADGGTLLIDEIGDLELGLQAKMLRAIERSEVQRVGGRTWIRTHVRVLAATRRDLDEEVQAGRFRDDLFFRLAVARIELPPLRRRLGDVPLLAQYFWQQMADPGTPIPPGFLQRLSAYSWPGNVRELYNAVARKVALGDLASTGAHPATSQPLAPIAEGADAIEAILSLDLPFPRAKDQVVAQFEQRYVERVLARHGGNVVRAAQASGIARRYFQIIHARTKKREVP
jgi:transcriptional regulator with GAF, ATPase, and Fis domain